MTTTFQSFVHDLIDYAGMFPPAKLPFGEAFSSYLRYRESAEKDMLARFILPMGAFAPFCDTMTAAPQTANPVRISALGGEAHKELTSVEEFATELTYLKMLSDSHPDDLKIETYEARFSIPLMVELLSDPERDNALPQLSGFGEGVAAALKNRENDGLQCFFEIPYNGFTVASTAFELAIDEFARINQRLAENKIEAKIGIKLRCGGERVPASYMVAEILAWCIENNVPFKATQGLHHPFFSNSRDERHGFVSLFAAGVLAAANHLTSVERIAEMISDGATENFQFTDTELIWNNKYHATGEQIEAARKNLFVAFGSCSFDEPRNDLRAAGLI